ncbi:MAG: hypothetical protein AAFZ18_34060 [Myxococcota bacterium]
MTEARRPSGPTDASSGESRKDAISQGWIIFTVFFSPFVFCFAVAAVLALLLR